MIVEFKRTIKSSGSGTSVVENPSWKDRILKPDKVLDKIRPGMNIFLGTGVAEPRTIVQHLMASKMGNLSDLTLIQLISVGEALPIDERYYSKYRLKTFFSGYAANEAVSSGRVDLIRARFTKLPGLIASGTIQVDAAYHVPDGGKPRRDPPGTQEAGRNPPGAAGRKHRPPLADRDWDHGRNSGCRPAQPHLG